MSFSCPTKELCAMIVGKSLHLLLATLISGCLSALYGIKDSPMFEAIVFIETNQKNFVAPLDQIKHQYGLEEDVLSSLSIARVKGSNSLLELKSIRKTPEEAIEEVERMYAKINQDSISFIRKQIEIKLSIVGELEQDICAITNNGNKKLNDAELTNFLQYINNEWIIQKTGPAKVRKIWMKSAHWAKIELYALLGLLLDLFYIIYIDYRKRKQFFQDKIKVPD